MESQKFKHIENNLINIAYLIAENKNIKRLVKYLDNNPLDLSKPDVEDDLIYTNIFLTPFSDDLTTKGKVFVFINPLKGNFKPQPIGEELYVIDIIVPLENWVIRGEGQLRAFRIAHEISKMIDAQEVAGLGEVEISEFKVYKLNEHFAGLSLFVEVNSVTAKI